MRTTSSSIIFELPRPSRPPGSKGNISSMVTSWNSKTKNRKCLKLPTELTDYHPTKWWQKKKSTPKMLSFHIFWAFCIWRCSKWWPWHKKLGTSATLSQVAVHVGFRPALLDGSEVMDVPDMSPVGFLTVKPMGWTNYTIYDMVFRSQKRREPTWRSSFGGSAYHFLSFKRSFCSLLEARNACA